MPPEAPAEIVDWIIQGGAVVVLAGVLWKIFALIDKSLERRDATMRGFGEKLATIEADQDTIKRILIAESVAGPDSFKERERT